MDTPTSPKPGTSNLSQFLKIIVAVVVGGSLYFWTTKRAELREQERKSMAELEQTRRELGDEMKRDLDKNGGISADTAAKSMVKMRAQLDKMSAQGGTDGKEMKAAVAVMNEIQEKSAPYIALIKRVETESPMNLTTVKDKADLASRKAFGQEMLGMNRELTNLVNSVEDLLRAKLAAAGTSGKASEDFVTGFMRGFGRSAAIQRRVRKTDEKLATSLIAMADLLDANWGKWKAVNGEMSFEDDATLKSYNELIAEMVKASDEQGVAQRELVELQQHK